MDKNALLRKLDYRSFYIALVPSLRGSGKQLTGRCPFHEDKTPSFSVNTEQGTYYCHGGVCNGGGDSIDFYMKLNKVDFPTALKGMASMQGIVIDEPPPLQKTVAKFIYHDTFGKEVYSKRRIEPGRNGKKKEYLFLHKDKGTGKTVTKRGDIWLPYRLPDLMAAKKVIFVEGEQKADLLREWGFDATSLDSGAKSPWKDSYLPFFLNKEEVVIIPDNDEPGVKYAVRIAGILFDKIAGVVKIVQLPGLVKLKEDIVDWENKGGTKQELEALILKAPPWTPQSISIEVAGLAETAPTPIKEYSLKEYATLLGCSVSKVSRMANKGEIKGRQVTNEKGVKKWIIIPGDTRQSENDTRHTRQNTRQSENDTRQNTRHTRQNTRQSENDTRQNKNDEYQGEHNSMASYFRGEGKRPPFIPSLLGNEILEQYSIMNIEWISQRNMDLLFIYENGVYIPKGVNKIKRIIIDKLQDFWRANRSKETLEYISEKARVELEDINLTFDPDENKYLINVENGMFNVLTRKLMPHSPEYRSTIRIPIKYDPNATCPKIEEFLSQVLSDDCLDIWYEMMGYFLLPDARQEKAFILIGDGANGKSTAIHLVEHFVGKKNVSHVAIHDFIDNRFKLANLYSKLVNTHAEIDKKVVESVNILRGAISGDEMEGEKKNMDYFNFDSYARFLYGANTIPKVWDKSFAFYRRLILIPFPYTFLDESVGDKEVKKVLKGLIHKLVTEGELSGLFNLAIEGLCRLYCSSKFSENETTDAEMRRYKIYNDPVFAFMEEKCRRSDSDKMGVGESLLYGEFIKYCEEVGIKRPVEKQSFMKRVVDHGVRQKVGEDGRDKCFIGICMKR